MTVCEGMGESPPRENIVLGTAVQERGGHAPLSGTSNATPFGTHSPMARDGSQSDVSARRGDSLVMSLLSVMWRWLPTRRRSRRSARDTAVPVTAFDNVVVDDKAPATALYSMLAGEPSSTTSEPPARLKLDMGKLQRLLSESESKVALAPRWSTTRLHAVVEADDTEAVGLLLRSGACADVNAPNPRLASTESEGWRALHAAAQRGETAMLALLLSHGANLHATTRNNVTALHVAAFHGRLGAVKLLIARGADAQLADSNGSTALDNAKYQSVDCACKQASAERQREWARASPFWRGPAVCKSRKGRGVCTGVVGAISVGRAAARVRGGRAAVRAAAAARLLCEGGERARL